MSSASQTSVDSIRAASRKMVRELGFMQSTIAGTSYPPSAVHAIVEIGTNGATTAASLSDLLRLEKSSVSRMVRKLIDAGELREERSERDGRAKHLELTTQGSRSFARINAFARRQVSNAIDPLSMGERKALSSGLATYANALEAARDADTSAPISVHEGYRPGVIGRIAEMHALYYALHFDFGEFFERQVATGVADFVPLLSNPKNRIWTAVHAGNIVGSVAIEDKGGRGKKSVAHLRWFIVDESCQGLGVGRQLIERAIAHADASGFGAVHLWTFAGLDAARALYERNGFELAEERTGDQWGKTVVEQRFVRQLNPAK